jgi:hypothetical protein
MVTKKKKLTNLEQEWAFWCASAMLFDWSKNQEPLLSCICDEVDAELPFKVAQMAGDRQFRYQPKKVDPGLWGLWWPDDHKGDQARKRFCWRMAEKCEKEMNQSE